MNTKIILASGSSGRLKLLKQLDIVPDEIIPADIDESRLKGEKGNQMALRLAKEKAQFVADLAFPRMINQRVVLIAADTVPVCRGQIMRKAETINDIKESIKLLSGKRHVVYTGLCMMYMAENGEIKTSSKITETVVKFRQIPQKEIEYFANLKQGLSKAGGYSLCGYAECFVTSVSGSASNVIGLPLNQVSNFFESTGASLYKQPSLTKTH